MKKPCKLPTHTMQTLKKLWRTVEDTTGHQFDPIGNVINLSDKTFTKETFQFLNKNLNFLPTPSIFNPLSASVALI